ncbi:hypothetical protein [Azospirillum argentinense]|uniref:hypothetical protein n=1 Tax=Azospirillum argentinense TaxID=2970906 RepID=UPI0032DF51CA
MSVDIYSRDKKATFSDWKSVDSLSMGSGPLSTLLSDARDRLCADALAAGVRLVISEAWQGLEQVNRANLSSWLPIMHQPNGSASFWIGAVDARGDVVGTQAGVLLDCSTHSFGDKLSDLTFFYADPTEAAPGERCFCASNPAFETRGKVCYITAGWTHPRMRGMGLFHLIGRVVRILALAWWTPKWWVGMVAPETAPQWTEAKAGRRLLEARPTILYQHPSAGYDYPPLRLLRFCRAGVVLDMQALIRQS